MKNDKKLFSVLMAVCLVLSIVESPVGDSAKAASGKKIILKEGKSVTLKVEKSKKKIKRIIWKSKNKKIATVSRKGKVKAKSVGNTKISAKVTLRSGKKYTSVYKISVQRKKNSASATRTAFPKEPTTTATALPQKSTANPTAAPQPLIKPKIEAALSGQSEIKGWGEFQAQMDLYTSTYSKPDIENQFVASCGELAVLIKKLKEGALSAELEMLLRQLNSYDEKYFQKYVLCLVNVQVPCGYRPSITQLYKKDNGGELPDVMIQYVKIKEMGDNHYAPGAMVNYIYRLEIERAILEDRASSNPIILPRIKTASTSQEAISEWKPIQTKLVSCTKLRGIPHIENQLVTSYDELTALIEELKAELSPSSEQILSEIKKYDEEYFQNHVLCLMVVELADTCVPSVKKIYSGGSGELYPDIIMQYAELETYEYTFELKDDYLYRIELSKSEVMSDYAEAK